MKEFSVLRLVIELAHLSSILQNERFLAGNEVLSYNRT
jgi:hypothetical protein